MAPKKKIFGKSERRQAPTHPNVRAAEAAKAAKKAKGAKTSSLGAKVANKATGAMQSRKEKMQELGLI